MLDNGSSKNYECERQSTTRLVTYLLSEVWSNSCSFFDLLRSKQVPDSISFNDIFLVTFILTDTSTKIFSFTATFYYLPVDNQSKYDWLLKIETERLRGISRGSLRKQNQNFLFAQSAGAVEYTDCFSAEG